MKRILFILLIGGLSLTAVAQPKARRQQQEAAARQSNKNNMTLRSQLSFPTEDRMNEDVVWRRDVYRELNLNDNANAALYYPVEPLGSQMSLFTYLLFGINVTDSQSGLRIFSKRAINGLQWKSTGYEFCSEMIWRAKQARMSVGEYPIKAIYTDYSRAKGQNNWNAINIVKRLCKQRIAEIFE